MTKQLTLYVLETEGDFNGQFEGGRVNLFTTEEARDDFLNNCYEDLGHFPAQRYTVVLYH